MPGLFFVGPAGLTLHGVVAVPRTDPFALCTDVVLFALAVSYSIGVLRELPGAKPSSAAAASFFFGLVLLYAAIGSGYGAEYSNPSVGVGQHVVLMMVAPPLLALGHPRLAARGIRAARGTLGPDAVRVPAGRAGRVAGALHAATGVASWPLYYGSMAAYFLTAGYADSLRDPALLDVTQAGFVAVGILFWSGLVATGPGGTRRPFAFRMVAVIAGMPIETAVGLSLVLWPRPLAAGETLGATHAAGLLLWLASMLTSGVALGVVVVQWCIADAQRTDGLEGIVLPAIPTRSDGGAGRSRP